MKKLISISTILLVLFAQSLFVFPIQRAQAFDYVINDFNFYPTPNTPKPAKGVPYIDPNFHTTITRITDSAAEGDYDYAGSGYPKHDIENADGTMLLIQTGHGSGWALYNANPPYNKIREINGDAIGWLAPNIDLRWDATNPAVLYWTSKSDMTAPACLNKYTIDLVGTNDTWSCIHDFRNDATLFHIPSGWVINQISCFEEGTPSDGNSRYWGEMIQIRNNTTYAYYQWGFFTYDKDYYGTDNGKVLSACVADKNGTYPPTYNDSCWPTDGGYPRTIGYTSITRDGTRLWTGDVQFTFPINDLSTHTYYGAFTNAGHADLAISVEGADVIAGSGGYPDGNYYSMQNIATGVGTKLVHTPFVGSLGYHTSGNSYAKPGWAIYSTYNSCTGSDGAPGVESCWGDYEIFAVELTTRTSPPPRVWRIAKTHSQPGRLVSAAYGQDPFAKINRAGTKIWWGTGWNGESPYDVYQIDLPANWYEDLKIISSDTTPPAPPSGVTVN